MKTAWSLVLSVIVVMLAAPVFAADYGVQVPYRADGAEGMIISRTDWSPDGTWIVFGTGDIWMVSVEDGETINLTEGIDFDTEVDTVDSSCSFPCFTPGGKKSSLRI